MELIVEGRGTFLAKHQGRLRVSREKEDGDRGSSYSSGSSIDC